MASQIKGKVTVSEPINQELSLEELDGHQWPEPSPNVTGLVKSIHALRKRPIKSLTIEDMRRLIGQDVGLPWLIPMALKTLRDTAHSQAEGGFYDDDLLSAVLTRSPATWQAMPRLAQDLREILTALRDLSPYIESEVEGFLSNFPNTT
ncbi:contact-dependent growth inhibition system immunity protein [Streptomyces sp. NPDC057545]|uniref:contact-dependent growth inhibition system immunity protein n=1 Tax=Streptomyces sp. NPDC057545 TaxID=3346164 RepID=UPI0036B2EF3D